MKTKQKDLTVTNYYHPKADTLITKQLTVINKEVRTLAIDLANQGRPLENDASVIYLPRIMGLFQILLENILKIIGAFSLEENDSYIKEIYKEEEEKLKQQKTELEQDYRVLKKETKGLQNLSHLFKKWNLWKIVVILLSFAETVINYKILLLITPNQISAIIASVGIATSLFIISHTFKDMIHYFESRWQQWIAGLVITSGIILLLYSFSTLRVSFLSDAEVSVSDSISPMKFVAVNFIMWISATIVVLIYKPLKKTFEKYQKYKILTKEIKTLGLEITKIEKRLDAIPKEMHQKITDFQNLRYMAKHYEQIISANYQSSVALFTSENIFRRKDSVSPKAFLEQPTALTTYFDTINHLKN